MNQSWRDDTDPYRLTVAVRLLKRRVELAYHQCDETAANDAHDDLCAAEWRLRASLRRRRRRA